MKNILLLSVALLASARIATAWHAQGTVYCDSNGDGRISAGDFPLSNVSVKIANASGTYQATLLTDATGFFRFWLPDVVDSYIETLDVSTLPSSPTIVLPAAAKYEFTLTDNSFATQNDWLISSPDCAPEQFGCWLTGGGTKFETVVNQWLAQHGPEDSFGGNVFPSCDPSPGNGGSWNHVAHSKKLHFHGTDIFTVDCGNVPGIEPGSESPVTPFNFIEFQGVGTLKGIKGNKVDHGLVFFFARCEDRNEPGSRGAKEGVNIDRYFLRVFDAAGTTLLLIDGDGNPATVDPVTITGGNLQLHVSSCDDPPQP